MESVEEAGILHGCELRAFVMTDCAQVLASHLNKHYQFAALHEVARFLPHDLLHLGRAVLVVPRRKAMVLISSLRAKVFNRMILKIAKTHHFKLQLGIFTRDDLVLVLKNLNYAILRRRGSVQYLLLDFLHL